MAVEQGIKPAAAVVKQTALETSQQVADKVGQGHSLTCLIYKCRGHHLSTAMNPFCDV